VVAAYLMLRPCATITVLLVRLSSALGLGLGARFLGADAGWNVLSAAGGDTAWWAHVGGFAAAPALTLVFRRPM
jgi:membrane associated rhomboid family serine protease